MALHVAPEAASVRDGAGRPYVAVGGGRIRSVSGELLRTCSARLSAFSNHGSAGVECEEIAGAASVGRRASTTGRSTPMMKTGGMTTAGTVTTAANTTPFTTTLTARNAATVASTASVARPSTTTHAHEE